MVFIGPSAEAIDLFGDKISAKNLVREAGVPTIPGYQQEDQSMETLLSEVEKIGFPCIVKAAAGGGGRGLKVIRSQSEARGAIESAQREGLSAFGSDKVFLEKYLDRAKHIEVQIFADSGGRVYSLLERECSVQRRHRVLHVGDERMQCRRVEFGKRARRFQQPRVAHAQHRPNRHIAPPAGR